jgi:hypothetical protein
MHGPPEILHCHCSNLRDGPSGDKAALPDAVETLRWRKY